MRILQKAFGSYEIEDADPATLGVTGFTHRVPAGDLLGLRDEQPYYVWLERRWGSIASRRRAKRWIQDGNVEELVRLANAAMAGRIPYAELGPRLERIQFQPGHFTCPDFPTLAAWSLERSAQSGVRIVECPKCQRPHFVSRGSSTYCRRPAPGLSTTCAQSYAHEVFSERRSAWNKEYRRIHARKLRGTVSEEEWTRWRTDPDGSGRAPEIFTPFDRWVDPQFEIDRQKFYELHRAITADGQEVQEPKKAKGWRCSASFSARSPQRRQPGKRSPAMADAVILERPTTTKLQRRRNHMPRAPSGQVVERQGKRGVTYALRFRAYGSRQYITLGTAEDGWTRQRAEEELANVLADVRRGIWRPAEPAPHVERPTAEPTFHAFSSEWLDGRRPELKPRSIEALEWALQTTSCPSSRITS